MKYIIGIDEAGRGPWLGPVSACALCFNPINLPHKSFIEKLNDSKKLSEKKREEIYLELINMSLGKKPQIFFGVGIVDNFIIDEINIRQANREAMRRAILELSRKVSFKNIEVLIDGRDNYDFEELKVRPTYIIGGDGKISEIGAASIIAKVFRDKILVQYASLYPDLGIENHKGYGTKKHSDNLKTKKDITGIHRLSYKPVKKFLEK
ncbi:MAG: ribonuclease HII [Candidatus Gracilibacteria bacterium]|nr:ribonuclease HII [Candidatus Gracilibacteria bacterium]MDQ7023336.1 ribonuclease HII [Candidatus Gracilibacteria bacterium]